MNFLFRRASKIFYNEKNFCFFVSQAPAGGTMGFTVFSLKLLRTDAANDIVLLKAEGRFAPLPIAASRAVKLGGTVATVGFPNPATRDKGSRPNWPP